MSLDDITSSRKRSVGSINSKEIPSNTIKSVPLTEFVGDSIPKNIESRHNMSNLGIPISLKL